MNADHDTATLLDEFKRLAVRGLELEAEALFEDHALSEAKAAEFETVALRHNELLAILMLRGVFHR